jgi:hypothetical protein
MSNRENSITIEGIDEATFEKLLAKAKQRGVTIGVIAREALQRTAETPTPPVENQSSGPWHDLDHLAGTWTDEDLAEFNAATADFEKIDPELWS